MITATPWFDSSQGRKICKTPSVKREKIESAIKFFRRSVRCNNSPGCFDVLIEQKFKKLQFGVISGTSFVHDNLMDHCLEKRLQLDRQMGLRDM